MNEEREKCFLVFGIHKVQFVCVRINVEMVEQMNSKCELNKHVEHERARAEQMKSKCECDIN